MAACASDGGARASTPEASLLGTGGGARSAGWIEELRAVGSGAQAAHRVAPVPPRPSAQRIVESAGARPLPLARPAALALGPRLDGRDRDRLRAAASTTASPRLRVALEGAASAAPETELGSTSSAVGVDEGPGDVAARRAAAANLTHGVPDRHLGARRHQDPAFRARGA